jgi:hypothetical protein
MFRGEVPKKKYFMLDVINSNKGPNIGCAWTYF